jgi:hypothetical protein
MRSRVASAFSISAVFISLSGCSAGGTQQGAPARSDGGSGGSAGSNGAPASGGSASVVVDGSVGGSGGASWLGGDLPAPWQYYDEGTDRAYKDPSLGADVKSLFGAQEASDGAPAIAYPLDGAMHPLNLGEVTFHWSRGASENQLFRIDAAGEDGRTSRFYVTCNELGTDQCTYQMPKSDWLWLAADYAGKSVSLTVTATGTNGGATRTSAAVKASFSPEPVFGALYYWAAQAKSLKRATFGAEKAVPFIEPESSTNQFKCVACHSVSRDGKVIAFAVSNDHGESVAAIQTAPTENPAQPFVEPTLGTSPFSPELANVANGGTLSAQPTDQFGHNVALSPDGSLAAVNGIPAPNEDPDGPDGAPDHWPPYLELRNAKSGARIQRYYLGDPVFGGDAQTLPILPEWSPDGASLAVALANSAPDSMCLWTYVTCNSPIAVIPVEAGSALGEPRIVATNADPEEYNYYPTWSPDGQWIVFQSARRVRDDSNTIIEPRSLGNSNGVIRMVRSSGGPYVCPGPECIELTRGTGYTPEEAFAGAGKAATWPKFTPFSQGPSGALTFVSYTSHLPYGFHAGDKSQLWMFAVDTANMASASDPSYAPIWLPYQDENDGALTPYWTETLPCNLDANGGCSGCVTGEQCFVTTGDRCECRAQDVR